MSSAVGLQASEKATFNFGTSYKLHHIIFWVLYFLFWVFLFKPGEGTTIIIVNSLVIIAMHALASYINLYFLLPKLLKQRLYFYYIVSVLLTISFVNTVHALLLNALLDGPDRLWNKEFYITNGMAIAYTVAITLSLKLVKQWYERDQQNKALQKLNTETELKFLKSQINPHFLFNTLNSLYALSLKKSDSTPELVLKLSDILRYVIYDSTEDMVPLEKEINYLKSYLDLEQIRYGDRVAIDLKIHGNALGKEIAPLLFIPFVENSFKHGFGTNTLPGYLNIDIFCQSDHLVIRIINSVNGKKASENEDYQGGIGLRNVSKRLKLLYPKRHEVVIEDRPKEYQVELIIQLNQIP